MDIDIKLDPIEARVFGVLVEKALTTPDQYPLSINAATNAANQKTNRDPVLSLDEGEVAGALNRLERRYLARRFFPSGSRVEKFGHNGREALGLSDGELAVLAELLMRGPQTAGDLRARAGRMVPIGSIEQLMSILNPLLEKHLIARLAPVPGGRAERFVQLVSPDLHPLDGSPTQAAFAERVEQAEGVRELTARVEALEAEVERLREAIDALAAG
jgi:hypothetical protein